MFKYEGDLRKAIRSFWSVRGAQQAEQKARNTSDQGFRGAVTGGKQLDALVKLLRKVSLDAGVPENCIFTRENELPGFFRPTKEWDFLVISPKKKLVACIEFKSQVGPSFGNNFNNRAEEALGSAVDLLTAYRDGVFPNQVSPWLGYLMLIERCDCSTTPVSIKAPHFKVMREFNGSSYLDRYAILCRKLMRERLYTNTSLIWTQKAGAKVAYGYTDDELSFEKFIEMYSAHLAGQKSEFVD